jgi:hypothetical protein
MVQSDIDYYKDLTIDSYIEVAMVNSFLNADKYGETDYFLTQEYEYATTLGNRVDIDFYLQYNTANVQTSRDQLTSGEKTEFYSVKRDRVVQRFVRENQFGYYIKWRLDEVRNEYKFKVYSFMETISQFGGSIGFFHVIFTVILTPIVYRLWTVDILNLHYQMVYDTKEKLQLHQFRQIVTLFGKIERKIRLQIK